VESFEAILRVYDLKFEDKTQAIGIGCVAGSRRRPICGRA
jgi:hypothetical protein